MVRRTFTVFLPTAFVWFLAFFAVAAQTPERSSGKSDQPKVRTVVIPISIFTKEERKKGEVSEILETGELRVLENNEDQAILSIRSVSNTPLHLAVLIQDNLGANVNLQLDEIRNFIRRLPSNSRVMVAYLRSGSPQTVQKFTNDLEKAASSVRIVVGSESVAPNNPYDGLSEILGRFDALPTGRRAVLLVTDGLDVLNPGLNQSLALDRAVLRAQRRSVAVYSFFSTASGNAAGTSDLVLSSQSSLLRLAEETGGRAYFQGTAAPISFEPFFKDLNFALTRQFALTYLSTHPRKGYYKIEVKSGNPLVKIEHPRGYYYRGR